MIRVTGTLTCSTAAEAETVTRHLPEHIRLSRAEPGCRKFEVTPTADPMVWALDECFIDRDAFNAHQARTKASSWFTDTQNLARDFRIVDASESN